VNQFLWFALKWNFGFVVMGLIAFGLFSAGHTAFGFLIILLFFALCAVDCVRLSRRAKKSIVNRVNSYARATFRSRLGRFVLSLTILLAAVLAFVFFGRYIMLGLIALIVLAAMLTPLARTRGRGAEGRLTRYLNRPRFDGPSRRSANGTTAIVKREH